MQEVFISILEASTSTNMNQTSSTGYIRLLKIIRMARCTAHANPLKPHLLEDSLAVIPKT
eukprot:546532-Amphidinium_carterae.1